MRAMKKTISVLLTLALVLGMFTMAVGAASAAETTISATSNIADTVSEVYTANNDKVTVTYSIQTEKPVVNGQGVITFDTSVLKVSSDTTAASFFPNVTGGLKQVNLTKTDGRIPFNFSTVDTADFSECTALVAVVFDIIGTGNTEVNLNLDVLTVTNGSASSASDDEYLVDSGVVAAGLVAVAGITLQGGSSVEFVQVASLALEGKIGINYYFFANPGDYTQDKMSVKFEGPNADENKTVAYSTMQTGQRNGALVCRYTYFLKAYMMTQPVVAKFLYDGQEVGSYTMTIEEWAIDRLPAYDTQNPNAATLIKTMLNYGAACQTQFGYWTDDLANKRINYALVAITPDTIEVDADANIAPDLTSMGATWQRMTAELRDGIALRLYISANDPASFTGTVSCAGEVLPWVTSTGSKTMMAIKDNIYSYDMDTYYTFNFSNGATLKSSVMSFVRQTMINNSTNQNVQNLCSSMYWYNQAANTFFGK